MFPVINMCYQQFKKRFTWQETLFWRRISSDAQEQLFTLLGVYIIRACLIDFPLLIYGGEIVKVGDRAKFPTLTYFWQQEILEHGELLSI